MPQIIDGKKISQEIKDELKEKVAALKQEGKEAALAVIQVGDDPASGVYVNNKKKGLRIYRNPLAFLRAAGRYHGAGTAGFGRDLKSG